MTDATLCDRLPSEWMDLLSDEILRNFTSDTWSHLFFGPGRDGITLLQQQQTLLYGMSQDAWDAGDHAALARRCKARTQHAPGNDILMAFPTARAALHAAVTLQGLESHLGVRTALSTGVCTAAEFTVGGCRHTITLGALAARAYELARQAPTGSIVMCPNTYALLEDSLGGDLRDALVVTEMESSIVLGASVILGPPAGCGAGAFTGLGRN